MNCNAPHSSASKLMVSIVVDHKEENLTSLNELLTNLCEQTYRNFEVLLRVTSALTPRELHGLKSQVTVLENCSTPFQHISLEQSGSYRGDYVLFLESEDRLVPTALECLLKPIAKKKQSEWPDIIIFDYQIFPDKKRYLPGWDPDLINYLDYIQSACLFSKLLIEKESTKLGALTVYEFLKHLSDKRLIVEHVREFLGTFHRKLPIASPLPIPYSRHLPPIAIIIPNKDKYELLRNCIKFLYDVDFVFELIIVDNGSSDPRLLCLYEDLTLTFDVTIVPFNRSFNYAAMINIGSRHAKHPFLLFLNNDVIVSNGIEVAKALAYAQGDQVGLVGSLLCYPDGTVQHAGMALFGNSREDFDTLHVLRHSKNEEGDYIGALTAPRNWQSVTGAFQLTRKSNFQSAGGYDEVNLPIEFNDVDFCLRIRELGLRVVCLPLSGVFHYESHSRAQTPRDTAQLLAHDAYLIMCERWARRYSRDPFVNQKIESRDLVDTSGHYGWIRESFAKVIKKFARGSNGRIKDRASAIAYRASLPLHLVRGVNIIYSGDGKTKQIEDRIATVCQLCSLPVRSIRPEGCSALPLDRTAYDVFPDGVLNLYLIGTKSITPLPVGNEGRFLVGYVITTDYDSGIGRSDLSPYHEVWVISAQQASRLSEVFPGTIRIIELPDLDEVSVHAFGREIVALIDSLELEE
jgi:GT2 family glycosyltransferase